MILARCSRESRARCWEAETQSDTAWSVGMEQRTGVEQETGAGREVLNMRRRMGLSGATFGMRIVSGGRCSCVGRCDGCFVLGGWPMPMERE